MTDSALIEIDVSDIYSQGQAFVVKSLPYSMYGIELKRQGTIPEELSGRYTSPSSAKRDIITFIARRKQHNELVERRKKAKVAPKRTMKTEETKVEE